MNIREMAEALLTAMGTVEGCSSGQVGQSVDPPALVLSLPQLLFEGYCADPLLPSSGTFIVWVVAPSDEWAMGRLWDLVTLAATAVETVSDAGVSRADPAAYPMGTVDLPAYMLTVPVTLS